MAKVKVFWQGETLSPKFHLRGIIKVIKGEKKIQDGCIVAEIDCPDEVLLQLP